MFIKNGKRINIYSSFEQDGVKYHNAVDPTIRMILGITEIPDPVKESDETHYNQEIDEAPYLISTLKSQEQLDAQDNAKLIARIEELESKQARALREAVLTGDKTKLQDIEDKIVQKRAQLKKQGE